MRDPLFEHWRGLIRGHAEEQGQKLSDDVLEELASHFADLYAAARDHGESEDEAHRSTLAVLERGALREIVARSRGRQRSRSRLDARDLPSPPGIRRVWNDVIFDARYALRGMRRNPAFTTMVVAILAVGIGATTAGFTVIDAVLLRALPYPEPDRLVALKHVTRSGVGSSLSPADWRDYSSRNAGQLSLAAYASWPMNLTGDGEPARLRSVIVSGNFFEVAGQRPLLGRFTGEADDRPSAPGVVVLSHNLWTVRFARDPAVVGRDVVLNGHPATIVGVMPADFALPTRDVDLWMPMGPGRGRPLGPFG